MLFLQDRKNSENSGDRRQTEDSRPRDRERDKEKATESDRDRHKDPQRDKFREGERERTRTRARHDRDRDRGPKDPDKDPDRARERKDEGGREKDRGKDRGRRRARDGDAPRDPAGEKSREQDRPDRKVRRCHFSHGTLSLLGDGDTVGLIASSALGPPGVPSDRGNTGLCRHKLALRCVCSGASLKTSGQGGADPAGSEVSAPGARAGPRLLRIRATCCV